MQENHPPGYLPPSELVLTDRGTIYHLDLPPEALAGTVITVGDPARVEKVSRHFDAIEYRAHHREFVSHSGRIGDKTVMVVSSGIGTDNMDIVLTELDALANIDFVKRTVRPELRSLRIVRLGTAGSLQDDVPVDSFVVSSFAMGFDNLMHFYDRTLNPEERYILEAFGRHLTLHDTAITPYIAEGSIPIRNLFGVPFADGITVTCPGFYGPQGRALRAPLALPDLIPALSSFSSRGERIVNFEMETSALYGLGKALGHSCLSVSAIVANRVDRTFSRDSAATIDRMIAVSLDCLF